MDANVAYTIAFFVCLLFSAFFSSSETAFVSLQKVRIRHLVDSGISGANEIQKFTALPEKFLATILLGNNFVNTTAAALGTLIAVDLLGEGSGVLVSTIAVTFLLLVFGEIIPKIVATRTSERIAFLYIHPMTWISWLFSPFTAVLAGLGTRVAKMVGGQAMPRPLTSEQEILAMISMGREEGAVEKDEADIMERVFRLGDRQVSEIMTPRPSIIWVEKDTTVKDFLPIYEQSPHSRFPIHDSTVDDVVGVLWIRDVLMAEAKGELSRESSVTELARPAYFVPESKNIGELFGEMRENRTQIAIIIDEYGGTAGLVSIEQLLEEIVGQLGDELAVGRKDIETIDSNTFQLDGGMRVDQANEELELDIPEGEYETIAGFILHMLGHIPQEGEQLKHKNTVLTVTGMKGVRIEKVLVTRE